MNLTDIYSIDHILFGWERTSWSWSYGIWI